MHKHNLLFYLHKRPRSDKGILNIHLIRHHNMFLAILVNIYRKSLVRNLQHIHLHYGIFLYFLCEHIIFILFSSKMFLKHTCVTHSYVHFTKNAKKTRQTDACIPIRMVMADSTILTRVR